MTGAQMIGGGDPGQHGALGQTAVDHERAAGVEQATDDLLGGAGQLALEDYTFLACGLAKGPRAGQPTAGSDCTDVEDR
jgi:hypothetical protein